MHRYTFVGACSRVFVGLHVGYGYTVRPASKALPVPPIGSTIHLHPGDVITCRTPIEHPELVPAPGRPPRMPRTPTAPDLSRGTRHSLHTPED